MTHQEIQLLTIALALPAAMVALWQLLRTLQTGVARTRSASVHKARRPRLFRMVAVLYGIGIVVLVGAAGAAGALLVNGQR